MINLTFIFKIKNYILKEDNVCCVNNLLPWRLWEEWRQGPRSPLSESPGGIFSASQHSVHGQNRVLWVRAWDQRRAPWACQVLLFLSRWPAKSSSGGSYCHAGIEHVLFSKDFEAPQFILFIPLEHCKTLLDVTFYVTKKW